MDSKPRLGRGLSALLGNAPAGDGAAEMAGGRLVLPLERILHNPHQPRKNFDDDELLQLSDSIRNHGILQPLVVRQVKGGYQLIAGERRLRAAQLAGIPEVPVMVVDFNDQQVLEAALVENIQRSDLNPIEKAHGFKEYLDKYGFTQEQLAARLCMDRTSISNLVNLLHLPEEVQNAVRLEQISLGHAKVLKGLPDAKQQVALCKEITLKGLSVKALELLVKEKRAEASGKKEPEKPEPAHAEMVEKTAHVQAIEDELRQKLATKLEIRLKAKDRGQIVIGFECSDDFERIVEMIRS
jgi:ParB family transcriptional regulator, chromosome partitioning protein